MNGTWFVSLFLAPALAFPQNAPQNDKAVGDVLLSFPLFTLNTAGPPPFRITEILPQTKQIRITTNQGAFNGFGNMQGHQILLLREGDFGPYLHAVPIHITDILEKGEALATYRPGAEKVLKTGPFTLIQPIQGTFPANFDGSSPLFPATTAQLRALPPFLTLETPKTQTDAAGSKTLSAAERMRIANARARSTNNLKQIMLALHNYHDTFNHFPPAVIYGPDGKPWHSWRVLILPYLEQSELFQKYDFREPWNSPKNKQVSDTVLSVYQDPIYGATKEPVTHYVAPVGEKALFPPQGSPITNLDPVKIDLARGAPSINQITDGTSNTIAVVPADPNRKIPWAKPEDLPITDSFPGLGKPGGIPLPYPSIDDKPRSVPVAFTDGAVISLRENIDPAILKALLTPRGGEAVSSDAFRNPPETSRPPVPIFKIFKSPDGSYSAVID
jgi:hypothetical protein